MKKKVDSFWLYSIDEANVVILTFYTETARKKLPGTGITADAIRFLSRR